DYCVKPMAEWLFEEKSGGISDSSGNGLALEHVGSNQPARVAGKHGTGVRFAGGGDGGRFRTSDPSGILAPDSITMMAWIKPDQTINGNIFGWLNDAYDFRLHTSNQVRFQMIGSDGESKPVLYSNATVSPGTWT